MLRRFVLPLILLIPLLSSVPSPQASADGVSALFASPSEGHAGDVIWLSGTGLKPFQQYYIFMGCPNWHDPTVFVNDNYRHMIGPVTDANGEFVRFPMRAFQLSHANGFGCYIYSATNTDTGFGPDIPAQYTIVPHGIRLHACAVQICGSVSMSSKSARSGRYETFTIATWHWAGVSVDMTVSFNLKGVPTIRWSGYTDWHGIKSVRIRIPATSARAVTASVSASFHLGHTTGRATPVIFTVVR
jgi:hypothetical protein